MAFQPPRQIISSLNWDGISPVFLNYVPMLPHFILVLAAAFCSRSGVGHMDHNRSLQQHQRLQWLWLHRALTQKSGRMGHCHVSVRTGTGGAQLKRHTTVTVTNIHMATLLQPRMWQPWPLPQQRLAPVLLLLRSRLRVVGFLQFFCTLLRLLIFSF